MTITILKPGLLTTLQDGGRVGYAALGVGAAGPMDAPAFRLANALVGNGRDAVALELTLIGPRLSFDADAVIAIAGADFDASIEGRPVPAWRSARVPGGSVLDCGHARRGARAYLAIAGGFAVDSTLGSAATDVNSRLGPFDGRPLRAGDRLQILLASENDTALQQHRTTTSWSLDPRPWLDADSTHPIDLIRGTHFDTLDERSRLALFNAEFRIGADSNRVGFQLEGPSLTMTQPLELISEAAAFGTLQLPPGGKPIALMAEHPITGGYPRVGQIAMIDLPRLAQRRPHEPVRFREIDIDHAQTGYLAHERELARLIDAVMQRLSG